MVMPNRYTPSRREFINVDADFAGAYDENGLLRDGYRIRIPLADSAPQRSGAPSAPLEIRTGLPLRGKDSLHRHFFIDGSPRDEPRKRRKTRETGPAELASFGEEEIDDAAHSMDARDRAYSEMVADLQSAWMSPEQRAEHETRRALTDAAAAGVDPREFARDRMISDMCSAWQRKPPVFDGDVPNYPTGAYAPVGVGCEEGDTVSFNGSPARLVRRGSWLFPEEIDVGPSRSSGPANRSAGDAMPPRTMSAADAQKIKDTAYLEMCDRITNAWRS